MKLIELTQFFSQKKILVRPTHFIIHQPRKIRLELPGKPAFEHTTLMSVMNPSYCEQVLESYDTVKQKIDSDLDEGIGLPYSIFEEFRHAETGTLFLVNMDFFEIVEPGSVFPDDPSQSVSSVSLVSLWNPALWVPVVGTYDEIRDRINLWNGQNSSRGSSRERS